MFLFHLLITNEYMTNISCTYGKSLCTYIHFKKKKHTHTHHYRIFLKNKIYYQIGQNTSYQMFIQKQKKKNIN